jgi:hypothetical protein
VQWVALANHFYCEPHALKDTMFLDRLSGVLGTGGRKPAGRRKERRDQPLVKTNEQHEQGTHEDKSAAEGNEFHSFDGLKGE